MCVCVYFFRYTYKYIYRGIYIYIDIPDTHMWDCKK